ncbi:hypothetical protein XH93_37505 [Bradyrhizobium sp. CCBAU 51753]|nr:hypothetical protein XH93_37505 [Bradyrhizobium sp. CCBAU 51753]
MKLYPHPHLSSPGLTGRSSTPRPLGSFTTASGILDHPPARVMTPSKLSKSTRHPEVAASSAALEGSTARLVADASFEARRRGSHLQRQRRSLCAGMTGLLA